MSQLFNFGQKWDQLVSRMRSGVSTSSNSNVTDPSSPSSQSVHASTPYDSSSPTRLFFFPPPNSKAPDTRLVLTVVAESPPSPSSPPSLSSPTSTRDRFGSVLSNRSLDSNRDTDVIATHNGDSHDTSRRSSFYSSLEAAQGTTQTSSALSSSGGLLRKLNLWSQQPHSAPSPSSSAAADPHVRDISDKMTSTDHWMDDSSCLHCYDCHEPFTTFRRRHHCRICGLIFCGKCSAQLLPGEIVGKPGSLRAW